MLLSDSPKIRGQRIPRRRDEGGDLFVRALHKRHLAPERGQLQHAATGHAHVVELQPTKDPHLARTALLVHGGAVLREVPARGLQHCDLHGVAHEATILQLADGVAPRRRPAQLLWRAGAPCLPRLVLAHRREGARRVEAPRAREVHAVLRDGARLVKHHHVHFACDGYPRRAEAGHAAVGPQPRRGDAVGQREGHRHVGLQGLREDAEAGEDAHDPMPLVLEHQDAEQGAGEHDHDHVDLGQLLSELERGRRREQNHSHERALRCPGARANRDADGSAGHARVLRLPAGALQHRGPRVQEAPLQGARGLECVVLVALVHREALHRHGLACEHALVDDRAALQHGDVARHDAWLDREDVPGNQLVGAHVLPDCVPEHERGGLGPGHALDLELAAPHQERLRRT
mmetsp:Transcript_33703/g.89490  ORF Transcript_33703/g.89490 Transcript_33703/m.89490 type:complete len:403 (-) Transcript_33703:238-1446(-)